MKLYRPVVARLLDGGKRFTYHNYDGEFRRLDGELAFERLTETFPADLMSFTLNTDKNLSLRFEEQVWQSGAEQTIACRYCKKDYAQSFCMP